MRKLIRERLSIVHLILLIVNLLVTIDFWNTKQEADTVIAISDNLVYNSGQSSQGGRQLGTYEVRSGKYNFEIPKQYGGLVEENSTIRIYSTKLLGIVKSIEVEEKIIPIAFWLYIIFALVAVILSAAALYLRHNIDFRSFAAVINGILSIMIIYIIWL